MEALKSSNLTAIEFREKQVTYAELNNTRQ